LAQVRVHAPPSAGVVMGSMGHQCFEHSVPIGPELAPHDVTLPPNMQFEKCPQSYSGWARHIISWVNMGLNAAPPFVAQMPSKGANSRLDGRSGRHQLGGTTKWPVEIVNL